MPARWELSFRFAALRNWRSRLRRRGRSEAAPVLVFLTDGIMDTGSSAKDAEMRVWLRGPLLSEARERGVRVFSIALTEQADYVLMQEMAAATKGDYFRALQVGEVAGIFAKIYARLTLTPSSVGSSFKRSKVNGRSRS